MSNFEVWLIIILVIGVIASNLAVLKYSAKFKLPQFGPDKNASTGKFVDKDSQAANDEVLAETKPGNSKTASATKKHSPNSNSVED